MEAEDINNDTVHPEVRAHVNSLVSAVSWLRIDPRQGRDLRRLTMDVYSSEAPAQMTMAVTSSETMRSTVFAT